MYRVELWHKTKRFYYEDFKDLEDAKHFAKVKTIGNTDRAYIKELLLREVNGTVYTGTSGIWAFYKSGALVDVM